MSGMSPGRSAYHVCGSMEKDCSVTCMVKRLSYLQAHQLATQVAHSGARVLQLCLQDLLAEAQEAVMQGLSISPCCCKHAHRSWRCCKPPVCHRA